MKISKVVLKNFRQYYGDVSVDLETDNEKNIVIIGGKNGYGKTNFLLSIVWCLFGEKIMQIDENFKREIQKDTNYQKFLKQTLNWDSLNEGNNRFSVEVIMNDLDLPINYEVENNCLAIKREFIVDRLEENLFIHDIHGRELLNEADDKINFINDYLIPLEAAKFVFFDAEKIASWAELSTKDEGCVLNDALGKLLGLDTYENLKEDLQVYSNNLKREGANSNIKEQIINAEKTIELNKDRIEEIDLKSAHNESEKKSIKERIRSYQVFLNQNDRKENPESSGLNSEDISRDISILKEKQQEYESKFNELSELIPLAMLGGKIQEVIGQIEIQDKVNSMDEMNDETRNKLERFVEKLFNHPPEPLDGSMTLKNKVFYTNKAQGLLNELFIISDSNTKDKYEFDCNNTDKDLIYKSSLLLGQQSKELFESTISGFNAIQLQICEKEKQLRIIDSDLQDETLLETITNKDEAERLFEKFTGENGALANQKDKLLKDNTRIKQQYNILLQKSNVNQVIKDKITATSKYINTLQLFIDNQKKIKKDSLAKNLLSELKKLMHKLQTKDSGFIEDTKIDIYPMVRD